MQHFLSIQSLSHDMLHQLLEDAGSFLNADGSLKFSPQQSATSWFGCSIFLEPSTRTRLSFEMAAVRCGGYFTNLDIEQSSFSKGESLLDTCLNLEAMGIQYLVIRLKEENTLSSIAKAVSKKTHVINAGEGTLSHPSQAVLDMLTIQRKINKPFADMKVAIIGDLLHSRVARSDLEAFSLLGVKDIRLVAPRQWQSEDLALPNTEFESNLEKALHNVDVVILLRIQKERMLRLNIDLNEYVREFQFKPKHLNLIHPEGIVMHPGPVNRDVEIHSDVLNDSHCVVTQQVTFGVAARMAIFEALKSDV